MSRTALQKKAAKKLYAKPAGELKQIDLSAASNVPVGMTRAYKNNRYVAMIFDNESVFVCGYLVNAIRVMVQRHDDTPIPNHWHELQKIKSAIFGDESQAIEFYPPQSELIDCANIYWLWVIDKQVISAIRSL